jgi:hypothetical protein
VNLVALKEFPLSHTRNIKNPNTAYSAVDRLTFVSVNTS